VGSRESDWRKEAERSVLLEAVSHWRNDPSSWFEGSYSRLPETLRVNPLSPEAGWIESWLEGIGATRIQWFNGPGSAWEMSFERGRAEGEVRAVMNALHETGRVTRQEAVSMLPVLALDPKPGDVVLDLCASPGSKTTQICEHLGDSGAVIANEVISGRVNTLVSNVQRHASRSAVVVQHDGRHIPMVPGDGFDGVLVDVPCTGSATTRKNPDVWSKWLPSSGRSLHNLQHDLLRRAIAVTKPGGRVVYSTCSLDPVENEAVVARILSAGGVSAISAGGLLQNVPSHPGMDHWPTLDDHGRPSDKEPVPQFMEPPIDEALSSQVRKCLRVWNDSIGGGGFFLAVLEKDSDTKIKKNASELSERPNDPMRDPDSFPQPIGDDWSERIEESWGSVPSSMWARGKSLLWSTEQVRRVWESERSRKGGKVLVPGGRWRPLKVIHLGLIAARIRHGELERVVSRAARKLRGEVSGPFVEVGRDTLESILLGNEPVPESVDEGLAGVRGGRVLVDQDGSCLAVWVGARITPMVSESEKTVMRAVRGLPIALEEEE
tara:strand:+ start:7305 stop:8951 length:1647 start_codon:yes stop_codon:yes gene_type:complete